MVVLHRSPGRFAFRVKPIGLSGVLRPRLVVVWLALACVTFLVFCLTIGLGSGDYDITVDRVIPALWGSGEFADVFIVKELRLPRAMVALFVGAAFGVSGAVFQALTRNPLASPDMLGITQGAGTAVAVGIVLGIGSGLGTQGLGLVGALAAAFAIYLLAWNRGTTGYRIVLVGIGVSWMCVSATTYLVSRTGTVQAQLILGWLVGNLNQRGWQQAVPLAVALAALLPLVLLLGRHQRVLGLGDEVAAGLGTSVQRVRLALLVAAAALAAFATAAAGPILFVALAAPQITRRLARTPAPPVTASALTGATLVLVSDLISQRIMEDSVMPVGVVTGVLGAPFLLWQLARANKAGSGG
ncbi:iron chelate uptake ABC transporter family permease subunit [Actinocorallia sp. API 0066]|uniref:FecCD family ABC transporter permease n=1 Tax=Actinocorallia sp. API 0066 TaxID=2896846 RepID=UPI001E2A8DD8|nr:iron chelate uptake ABC transporter family permease subunit [Actinocorallia sp. API 0066]MCD0450633.1 iron chelate uptake ABC transporter family permease subunit [Actinocorallia sp. API 0066]